MKITVLGSSAGLPTAERGLPAVLVEVEGELLLFDCGEGTQRQMMKAGASLGKRMKIFITHLHGDHLFGLPGMVQTMNLMNRAHPLDVYGPPGLDEFIEETTLSSMSTPSFELSVHEVAEGEIFNGRKYLVEGAWADHSKPSMAYRLTFGASRGRILPKRVAALGIPEGPLLKELKDGKSVVLESGRIVHPVEVLGEPIRGKVLVYSGDTRPTASVERLAMGADMLVHEATFSSELAGRAEADGHSTAEGAAQLAARAGVKRLILTHISSRYHSTDALLGEARGIFPDAEVADDLKTYFL
jgi:ribonuclease Z